MACTHSFTLSSVIVSSSPTCRQSPARVAPVRSNLGATERRRDRLPPNESSTRTSDRSRAAHTGPGKLGLGCPPAPLTVAQREALFAELLPQYPILFAEAIAGVPLLLAPPADPAHPPESKRIEGPAPGRRIAAKSVVTGVASRAGRSRARSWRLRGVAPQEHRRTVQRPILPLECTRRTSKAAVRLSQCGTPDARGTDSVRRVAKRLRGRVPAVLAPGPPAAIPRQPPSARRQSNGGSQPPARAGASRVP
jgi:hypothetical protein